VKTVSSRTVGQASNVIAKELDVDSHVVRQILERYIQMLIDCAIAEVPFQIPGLGKFYHQYLRRQHRGSSCPEAFEGKIHKEVRFELFDSLRSLTNGWVYDIGLTSNNNAKELAKLRIAPSEIMGIRKQQLLADQKSVGFRSELLFDPDDVPIPDKQAAEKMGEPLTIDDVVDQLKLNIDHKAVAWGKKK
jgi:hypothetical protein